MKTFSDCNRFLNIPHVDFSVSLFSWHCTGNVASDTGCVSDSMFNFFRSCEPKIVY